MDRTEIIKEYDRALDNGDIERAIRISADALAKADAEFARLRNSGLPSDDALALSTMIGSLHVEALFHAGALADAFSTGMLLLYRELSFGHIESGSRDTTAILFTMLMALFRFMESSASPDDPSTSTHASAIAALLGSLLWRISKNTFAPDSPDPLYINVRAMLADLNSMGAIKEGTAKIDGRLINLDNAADLLADAAGRARAISLFSVD